MPDLDGCPSYGEAVDAAVAAVGGGPISEKESQGWLGSPERNALYADDDGAVPDYAKRYGPAWLAYVRRIRRQASFPFAEKPCS